VIKALADALLTIGSHPLCSAVEVEQGDNDSLAFFLDNGKTGDPAWPTDLEATMSDYDQARAPYRLTVILPQATETWDDEPGWETPSAAERNPMLACA